MTTNTQQEIQDKYNQALHLYKTKNYSQAEVLFKEILKEDPQNADAWFNLGLMASNVRKYNLALGLMNKALSIKQTEDFLMNKGNVFFMMTKYDEAIACYHQAIDLNPEFIGVYNNIGVAYEKKEETDKAIEWYNKAIEMNPGYADAYSNLGIALNRKDQPDEAIKCYFKALELKPDHVDAHYNLGVAYKDNREVDNAVKRYERALEINPNYMDAYLNLGLGYLMQGDFERGWKYYEYRFHGKPDPKPEVSKPRPKWDGTPLNGKTIYVYHEQGIGDTIQFVRYLGALNSYNPDRVLFKCQQGLENTLKISSLGADIINKTLPDEIIDFDTYIPLLSLPYCLKVDENKISGEKYLKSDLNHVIAYKQKFFRNDKFKIGIFWQGSTEHKGDKKRSVPLKYFYPLFEFPNVQVYSLQKGHGIEQLQNLPPESDIINIGETFKDFTHTAAAIENLDLVITIDTAIAHLAGALGKPVWIILPTNLEWRWFQDEDTTIWYNSAKLFRPKHNHEREEVMDRIFAALEEKLSVRNS